MSEDVTQERRVPCEVYSRIVGYLRPIRNWNAGKRQEFEDRQEFRVPEAPVRIEGPRADVGYQ